MNNKKITLQILNRLFAMFFLNVKESKLSRINNFQLKFII